MNGALGTVRGAVWPEGGDPNSTDVAKQAPVCLVVEFDDVNLGEEVRCDDSGQVVRDALASRLSSPVLFSPAWTWALIHGAVHEHPNACRYFVRV